MSAALKLKRPAVETTSKVRKPQRKEIDNLNRWAHGVVGLSAIMSMVLNSMANAKHAPQGTIWLAYAMGALIPILVLMLGRVAGLLYRRKNKRFAYVVGGIAIVLLLLSVFHCTESITVLTGSHWLLASAWAIGIDCGLIACEIVSVVED